MSGTEDACSGPTETADAIGDATITQDVAKVCSKLDGGNVEVADEALNAEQTVAELSQTDVNSLLAIPDDIPKVSQETIAKLTLGLSAKLLPDFQQSKNLLSEVTENQRILIETVQQENAKFQECQALKEVIDTMEKAKLYHAKLLNIKKDMTILHEKSAKLKKRALKLQQQKQKEALQREQEREREHEKERMLIAKPAKSSPSS